MSPNAAASRTQSKRRRKAIGSAAGRAVRALNLERSAASIIAWCPSVGLHQDARRRLDAEELLEDAQRGRRGGGGSVSSVLDERADDELCVVGRAPAGPPRLVLE